jgi:hypothetical protein
MDEENHQALALYRLALGRGKSSRLLERQLPPLPWERGQGVRGLFQA